MVKVRVMVKVIVKIRVSVENSLENFWQKPFGWDAKAYRKEEIF
jgi:hypothetical protein